VRNLEKHLGTRLFDMVICNDLYRGKLPEGISFVQAEPGLEEEYSIYSTDLVDSEKVWRHDSQKLAQAVMDLYYERTGPLTGRESVVSKENQEQD
jgi:hypothetical protein